MESLGGVFMVLDPISVIVIGLVGGLIGNGILLWMKS